MYKFEKAWYQYVQRTEGEFDFNVVQEHTMTQITNDWSFQFTDTPRDSYVGLSWTVPVSQITLRQGA